MIVTNLVYFFNILSFSQNLHLGSKPIGVIHMLLCSAVYFSWHVVNPGLGRVEAISLSHLSIHADRTKCFFFKITSQWTFSLLMCMDNLKLEKKRLTHILSKWGHRVMNDTLAWRAVMFIIAYYANLASLIYSWWCSVRQLFAYWRMTNCNIVLL